MTPAAADASAHHYDRLLAERYSYPKLRLAGSWLVAQCRTAGLEARHDAADSTGMRVLHAVKP
ncbi:hypothetical protein ACH4D4_28795 [Streptomyces pristinaespiralis]|uniref:hypothetical protein n=1 Tax=Streptomyces pristinaespiralis TaxID=38300 RepID=UPI00378B9F7C